MRGILIVVGVAAIAGVPFLLGRESTGVGSPQAPLIQASPTVPSTTATSIPPPSLEVDYAANRTAAASESKGEAPVVTPEQHDVDVKEALSILEKAIRTHPVTESTGQGFEEKYKNASLGDLQTAKTVLQGMELATREKLVAQRFNDGLYEVVAPGVSTQVESTPGSPVCAMGSRQEIRNGEVVTMVTKLPGGEYPEYDAITAEHLWVVGRINSLLHPLQK